ncbi:hypothetical protein Fmac_012643 [Flemingia macrophylla]|uniref:Uncharacterized protein n=1 Tax=Flemingia macrophylla TaxID=520843 RepID=A0ABD1MQW2_9FABA
MGGASMLCYCIAKNATTNNNNKNNHIADERNRQPENLDMMTAAKILFTDHPKKKHFGFDLHLVQFVFACLPSLNMRKMEVTLMMSKPILHTFRNCLLWQYCATEVEQKRKQKEDKEAKEREKEMELNPSEVKEEKSDPQLSEVKVRLEKLEEVVKEIVVETKNQSCNNLAKNQVTNDEKKHPISSAPSNTSTPDSASNKVVDEDNLGKHNYLKSKPELHEESKGSVATANSSLLNPKGQNQSGGAS